MRMLVEPFAITTPIAGFNGGAFTKPDLSPIEEHRARARDGAAHATTCCAATASTSGCSAGWIGSCSISTVLTSPTEIRAVHFQPTVVRALEPALSSAFKIVGVSADHELLARCESELQAVLGEAASASRSQPYYLDITHPMANKGVAVVRLAALMGVPMSEIAVIGDGHNDVGMFAQSGLSIAMGNAPPDVQRQARFVTSSNDQNGFAEAVRTYILDA